jgi:hypothetical protein
MNGIALNKVDCQSVLPQFPSARGWEEIKFKFMNIIRSRDNNAKKEASKAAAKVAATVAGNARAMQSVSSAGIDSE